MMQVAVLTLLCFIGTRCEIISKVINKSKDLKDNLGHRKTKLGPNERLPSTIQGLSRAGLKDAVSKNDTPIFRHSKRWQRTSVSSSKWPKLKRQLASKAIARSTKMQFMQNAEETTVINLDESDEKNSVPNEYFSSYNIKQQLEKISKHIPESNVTLEVIGRTKEYQDIVLLKMTKSRDKGNVYFRADDEKYVDDTPQKKIILIVHGLSVMGIRSLVCLSYIPWFLTLVSYYADFLDVFDIFLIPMANPDGYAYTHSHAIWNKNVAPQAECAGVSLDRNFDVAWKSNRSISSCSQEYPGPAAFSEAETQAIRDVFHKYSHKIVAYLNVHAGTYGSETFKGDAVLYPKGYTEYVTDEDKYIDLQGEIDEAIRNASFQVYSVAVETLYSWYGKVTGSSVDYASTVYGIPFALELVMQLYDNENAPEDSEGFSASALEQVWSRVIHEILNYIWMSTDRDNEVR